MEVRSCDLLIIGSGAAALTSALTAAVAGLDVLVVEKDEVFGGASARSGGGLWIPGNPVASRLGLSDSRAAAVTYFKHETGSRYDERRVASFLTNGPKMVSFIEENTQVRFGTLAEYPDYHCDSPGGSPGGRSIFALNWDAAPLGKELNRLRRPLASGTFLGMQIGVNEVGHYFAANRNFRSFAYVMKCIALRVRDQFRAGRTLRLAQGNALIGGLAQAVFSRGTELWTSSPARKLLRSDGRVTGAIVDGPQGRVEVQARWGVVLATGGFPHDSVRRATAFPPGAADPTVWAMFPEGNSGDGIRLGESVGGQFDSDMKTTIALSPLTRLPGAEGRLETMPIFFNRGVPGVISVTREGERFVNEANSYHDWGVALLEKTKGEPEAAAWMVCDRRALRRFGLGPVRPAPFPHGSFVKSGYLKRGGTIGELARNAGINPESLERTVDEFNRYARQGVDPKFGRGTNAYQVANGDPDQTPNPCVGPLDQAPFYAIRVFAGSVGTLAGLKTDEHCRVLDSDGSAITGLYAVGNDMASITGGDYISGGCTIGPAMTFGYVAARFAIHHDQGSAELYPK